MAHLITRSITLSIVFVMTLNSWFDIPRLASAEVLITREQGRVSLQNQSEVDLLKVTWGQRSRDRLIAGDTWSVDELPTRDLFDEELPFQLYGYIDYAQWGEALNELPGSQLWARLHLSTAGFDVHKGSKISNLQSEHRRVHAILNLAQLNPQTGRAWITQGRRSALKFALLAYAARFAPPESLLEPLLEYIKPTSLEQRAVTGWPEGYERLPKTRESLRYAIATHGARALPTLLKFPEWAEDRGMRNPLLSFASLPESQAISALKGSGDLRLVTQLLQRFEAEDERARKMSKEGLLVARASIDKLFEARETGDIQRALSHVIEIVLLWRRNNLKPQHNRLSWVMCNYLNSAAQAASNEKRLIAAQAYLSLGRDVCFGHPFYRFTVAEFMRTRGDLTSFDLRWSDAAHWYRAAVWFDGDVIDRVRLIDTLAQLAMNEIAQGQIKEAQTLLREARTLETPQVPVRQLLVVAGRLIPTPDRRGQLAMIFLACLLGIGAFSAIMRVLFGRKG